MDELQATLDRVLSDPAELAKLTSLAGQLFGGGEAGEPASPPSGAPEGGGPRELLSRILPGTGNDKTALLKALEPYLREERQQRLRRALRFARSASLALTAMKGLGGEEHGI